MAQKYYMSEIAETRLAEIELEILEIEAAIEAIMELPGWNMSPHLVQQHDDAALAMRTLERTQEKILAHLQK